jgi:hypothetical protein
MANWFNLGMKLKDHPHMQYHNLPNWPPTYLTGDYRQETIEEFGILRGVTLDTSMSNRCFLMVEMQGCGYVSWLKFDNSAFRARFVNTINVHLNRPMKEIGELEVSD